MIKNILEIAEKAGYITASDTNEQYLLFQNDQTTQQVIEDFIAKKKVEYEEFWAASKKAEEERLAAEAEAIKKK